MRPLATEVDHVIIKASQARRLFDFLSQTMQLPVASDFKDIVPGVFSSGSVSVGNLHLECAQVGESTGMQVPSEGHAAFGGLCVDAPASFDPESLSARGLAYRVIAPPGPDGKPMFTNYALSALHTPEGQSSVTVYRENYDPLARKRRMAAELAQREGGPLGVEGAADIVVGAKDVPNSTQTWDGLLGDHQQGAAWRLTESDPTVKLVHSPHDGDVLSISLRVKSLPDAVHFLHGQNAIWQDAEGNYCLRPPGCDGLVLRLVQA